MSHYRFHFLKLAIAEADKFGTWEGVPDGLKVKALVDAEELLLAWNNRAETPALWQCGCGTINGVNLAVCRVCGRKAGET